MLLIKERFVAADVSTITQAENEGNDNREVDNDDDAAADRMAHAIAIIPVDE